MKNRESFEASTQLKTWSNSLTTVHFKMVMVLFLRKLKKLKSDIFGPFLTFYNFLNFFQIFQK